MRFISIILSLFILSSCSKEVEKVKRVGGLLPDMPNSVPVIASSSYKAKYKSNDVVIVAKGKRDQAAPSVSFESPFNGANVSGVVSVKIKASDNVGVTGVWISIRGVEVSQSYSYSWNTSGIESGFYQLTATARDAAGNVRSTSITVSISTVIVVPPNPVSGVRVQKMPAVLDQGSEGSCVAFAVGYAARSVEYYNTTGWINTFSPEHLYNQIKFSSDCYSGAAMQPALDTIMKNGILPFSSMPYTSGTCNLLANESQKQEALNYRINGYYKMYTTDSLMIKGMVRSNKPVIIGLSCDQSFLDAKAGFVWGRYSGSGSLPHCVVICGYDDGLEAYLIMNSWGVGWGDAGYSWIKYDFFTTRTGTYCYSIK